MTRINTNVSSLIAQTNLSRVNADLQIRLTRLSTGLRINSGKDDPAGLIASENLRRDIKSIEKAISNSERANQVIATADSALNQVTGLLNDIRALVVEASNSGAVSEEQIAANQLQVDSSLEAINRIAQTTTFQGRKLLNGSLDFTIAGGFNYSQIADLKVDQANFGTATSIGVSVSVEIAATQAELEITGIDLTSNAAKAVNTSTITAVAEQATGTLTLNGAVINLTAVAAGPADLAEGNDVETLSITFGAAAADSFYTAATNTLTVEVTQAAGVATIEDIRAAIAGAGEFTATTSAADELVLVGDGDDANAVFNLVGGQAASADDITIATTRFTDTYNNTVLALIEDTTLAKDSAVASYNAETDAIEVRINGTRTHAQIAAAISALDDFEAYATSPALVISGNSGGIDPANLTTVTTNDTAGNPGGLSDDVVFELAGLTGSEVFNFQTGTSLDSLVTGINLYTDATGVEASGSGTTLTLRSSAYGSKAFVDLKILSEGDGGDFTAAYGQGARDAGTDAIARINGVLATADGNDLSINTPSLDLSLQLTAAFTGDINFNISGGGAKFQIGPDVVSNQQSRIGIGSLNTARLGGSTGKLYQLQTGGSADLTTDPNTATLIVDEAINKVTTLRGRLGAYQRTTLETNIATLTDTLSNLSEAESAIRDADFAAESAKLTRAQILTQSTTSVLAIANSNPQNVLALLGR
jgi:flagellin